MCVLQFKFHILPVILFIMTAVKFELISVYCLTYYTRDSYFSVSTELYAEMRLNRSITCVETVHYTV